MEFTAEDLAEFKALYEKHIGISLSDGLASEYLTSLVTLMEVIYRPIPREACEHANDLVT